MTKTKRWKTPKDDGGKWLNQKTREERHARWDRASKRLLERLKEELNERNRDGQEGDRQ